ncbi:hypothetical protein BDP55DRAFT_140195 [Colletotrichum godetiae]|uniref:Uncharacterized protein n=1 Tax=Colletotrichum godetiae TaxID=1209918 RepID=A0AAJ0EYZ9_9PEZI|nr:uncharacterized protein BDP55DRAFT_140195 [Colletotrichum godetiae]KAK1700707.1 hypothetical protein BDP55DRAFT_140195 [Colletotrichum godetiae]
MKEGGGREGYDESPFGLQYPNLSRVPTQPTISIPWQAWPPFLTRAPARPLPTSQEPLEACVQRRRSIESTT